MNEVTPEQWVQELESGRWTPATGQLTSRVDSEGTGAAVDGHCCLGVLARLMGFSQEDIEPHYEWVGYRTGYARPGPDGELPRVWIHEGGPVPPPEWLTSTLASEFILLNDEKRDYPVAEIKKAFGLS